MTTSAGSHDKEHRNHGIMASSFGALGVVFGDIGTSPLYALRESFTGEGHELVVDQANVLGVLSLIFWSFVVVVSLKYLTFVMRADNDGEGGILALTARVLPRDSDRPHLRRRGLILIGLFGTALLYGDGMITPAISVLSAVEGTEVATSSFDNFVLPISVVILVALFAVQRRGTDTIGKLFGPVMVVWFLVLGLLGVIKIVAAPEVLEAIVPTHAVTFFADNRMAGFLALGSIFLVVTGGEALYADMGHFGRRPITVAWYVLVLPGLVLNYFGQGALLIEDPSAIDHPFYRMAPSWALVPLVVLATAATVIASQALISGAFSLTTQATKLGYAPRLQVRHTSAKERGQVYVPAVNWALMVACVGLVIGFRSSTNLAAAYGVAVTMTMAITTILFYVVAREHFGWSRGPMLALGGLFLVVDLGFLGANIPKIPHGGWFPLVAGAVVFTLLTTWRTGRSAVDRHVQAKGYPLAQFADSLAPATDDPPAAGHQRVRGAAVYLTRRSTTTPAALRLNAEVQHVVHERIIVVSVSTAVVPKIQPVFHVKRTALPNGVERADIKVGFLEGTDVPQLLEFADIDLDDAVFYVGAESIVFGTERSMTAWRHHLYSAMHRLALPASNYFHLPPDRTISIGSPIELPIGGRRVRVTPRSPDAAPGETTTA